jgi:phage shock protein A
MSKLATRGLIGRFRGLSRDRGSHLGEPRAVYDTVLGERMRAYGELKQAVAGVLYLRNRIAGDLARRRSAIARIHDELQDVLVLVDDAHARALGRQKAALMEEAARAEAELEQVRVEAEELKDRLILAREEIVALEREKLRAVTAVANANARRMVNVRDPADDPLAIALERVREEIARMQSEASLEKELDESRAWARIHRLNPPR